MIPLRVRGRVGQITEHEIEPDKIGKWGFEISFWDVNATKMFREPFLITGDKDNKPYETKFEAQEALKEAAKLAVEIMQEMVGGPVTGEHYDMLKGGILKNFKEQEH